MMTRGPEWDYQLEEETDRAERVIRKRGLQHRQDILDQFGAVPMFAVRDGVIAPVALDGVRILWESDSDNAEADREFIREMRRQDLPPGSFFVLNFPGGGRGYHWRLCDPDPT